MKINLLTRTLLFTLALLAFIAVIRATYKPKSVTVRNSYPVGNDVGGVNQIKENH